MIALANTLRAKAVGVAVGNLVRLRVAVALPAEDEPGAVADAGGLVREQMSYGA